MTIQMVVFQENDHVELIRARENRKHEEVESLIKENQDLDIGENLLVKDSIVNLYTGMPIKNKGSSPKLVELCFQAFPK